MHPKPAIARRRFLHLLPPLLGAAWLARGRAATDLSPMPHAPFRFIVVNDLHHADEACTPFLERLVAQMRTHGPLAFCLIVGDLADTGLRSSLEAVRDAFARLGAPIHPVPGNHDCDLEENTALFESVFPGARNHAFAHAGWNFLGLDSTDGKKWGDTVVGAESLAFLDRTLPTLDRAAPLVLHTHFPMARDVRMASTNADAVLARFAGFNLRAVFSGHYHAFTERAHGPAPLLTHVACSRLRGNHDGTSAEGYQLCTAHADGRLERSFVEFAPASKRV